MEDRLFISFDKSNKDATVLNVIRDNGSGGFETVKTFTGSEAQEIYERLTEKNVNGVLNKYIYSNHAFTPDQVELFEKIEKALGYKLFRWQKTYLITGTFRQYGKTTAKILRNLLAVNDPPLDLSKVRTAVDRLNRGYYENIQERLTAAGIPTRTVFYCERDKRRYERDKRHCGKETSVVLIDEMTALEDRKSVV